MILAHNLNIAMKRLVLGKDWASKRMKALRFRLIGSPGRVVSHARKLIIRLGAAADMLSTIVTARQTIRALAAGQPDDQTQPPSRHPGTCHQPPHQAAAPRLVRNSGPGLATVARPHAKTRPTCSGTRTKGSRDEELRSNRLTDRKFTHSTPRRQVCSGILDSAVH